MSRLSVEIESAFRSGTLILTANVRAARWLRHEYAQQMRRDGRQAWTTPPIEDWDTWVRRLWQSASLLEDNPPLLLTDLQERQVWLRMQREDAGLLVSPEGMAQLAAGAYALLCSYEAHSERNHSWGHTDAERFQQWAAAFDRECQRQNWLSPSRLEARVTSALDENTLALPKEILLVGFDRLTPAQKTLLTAVRAQGTTVAPPQEESAAQEMRLLRADDLRDEITLCAWWVRQLLETSEGEIRIGVVAPDAGSIRSEMERIFRRVLMPETDDISAPAAAIPFEFSLGQPLATVPVVKAALLLLHWAAAPLREEELSWLLLSGFLTSTSAETLAAARFDASQRESRSLSMEITLPALRRQLHPARWPVLSDLQSRLLQIEKTIAANDFAEEQREPSRWIDLVQTLLKQAGWPGGRKSDAAQYQAIAKWDRALEEIALLDFDGRLITFPDFLRTLATHAEDTLFATESQGAPVQIMGALEASGQRFDALWFLGTDDASWPLRGSMHPLLPYDVQQKTNMPHATPEADFELSRTITESLAASAPAVIISHASRNKDGELRPSPLVGLIASQHAWETSPEWQTDLSIPSSDHTQAELEEIADASGVIAWPSEQSAGGSEVLGHQAACPFRAFATKRLGAHKLNRSEWGLTAAERGDLLHKVLQAIWSPESGQLHTLEDLLAAKRNGTLLQIVSDAIRTVFAKELGPPSDEDPWLHAYLESEQRRLSKRILEWLDLEATRVPFEVIACEEDLKDVSVGGLKLRLRGDRIDEVSEFARLLIDYKTGMVTPADWKVPRPGDPQLPLYAAFGNVDDVCGLLIARIRAGETGISGMVKDAKTQLFADIKGTSPLLQNPYSDKVRDQWSEALLNLAHDFLRGEALVDPKDGRSTCEYCPLPGLCRVAERPALLEEDETESADD
jgi:ATP-dependent helicase/nuclease subunit B